MTAASIKPSGILLLFLPALATRLHWREMILIVVGAAGVAFLVFGTWAVQGGLGAFVTSVPELLPLYASMRGGRAVSSRPSQSGRMDGTNRRTCGRCGTGYSRT